MRLSLIERYIFRKVFTTLIMAIVGLVGVVWVVRAVQEVDLVMTKGQGLGTYLMITTLGVPTLTAAIAPIALLIAAVQSINTLSGDSEFIVMHAAGASRKTLLKPVLTAGLLTAVLVYVLMLSIGPSSMRQLRAEVTEVRADLLSNAIRDGAFRDIGSALTLHVASRAPGGVLKGVFLVDGRKNEETFTYLAETGIVAKIDGETFLVLRDGEIQRLRADEEQLSIIEFDSYALNVASLSTGSGDRSTSQQELKTSELFNPDPNDRFYQERPGYFRSELHARLTGGLYPIAAVFIIVAFLGFPRTNRQGQTGAATMASVSFVGVRVLGIVAESALRTDPAMVFVVWGLPILGILVPAAAIMSGRRLVLPKPINGQFQTIFDQIASLAPARISALAVRKQSPKAKEGAS